jgi:hypothetical protein
VDITPKPGFFNEPSIAVNPGNPQEVVVTYQKNASVAYSQDGGQTWAIAQGTAPKDYRVSGDVSITFDADGRAVLCDNAFDDLGTYLYWAHRAKRNGILCRRSEDAGRTWPPNATAVISHDSIPKFEDKPFVMAATLGPRAGDIYVGWVQYTLTATDILFSHSADGGAIWSIPIKISGVPGLPRDDNGALHGFNGVVAPDGTIYAVWVDRAGIMMAISHDGGISFTPEQRVVLTGPAFFGIAGIAWANGFPQVGIDRRSGRLFVAWSDYTNGDVDVFLSHSNDHGHTWSAPVRVNDDPLHDGADQFFQWLAVDPVSGAVNLIFYDRRMENKGTTVTLARSTDRGMTFTNYTWDDQSFEPDGDFLGDYLALAAYGNKVFGAWAHQTSDPVDLERGRKTRTVLRVGTADFN